MNKYRRAMPGFTTPDDFVKDNLQNGDHRNDEEDRLVGDKEGHRNADDEPASSRRRRFCFALGLMVGFLIFVVVAVSNGHTEDGQATTKAPFARKHPGSDPDENERDPRDEEYAVYREDEVDSDGTLETEGPIDEEEIQDDDDRSNPDSDSEAEVLVDENSSEGSPIGTRAPSQPPTNTMKKVEEDEISLLGRSIWGLNLQRTVPPNLQPDLVFIKGMKVGGTSIALALNRVAAHYKIKLAKIYFDRNRQQNALVESCSMLHGGSLYFRHGYLNAWQKQCMPNVRFVTVLRDPVWQQISFDAYTLNLDFFQNYPTQSCLKKQFIDHRTSLTEAELNSRLRTVKTCLDIPYRRNLTLIYIANKIRLLPPKDPGTGVAFTYKWIANSATYEELTGSRIIDFLKVEYFMVGVTERINQFLVLLALVNGWDFETIYYKRCKISNLDVNRNEFKSLFPDLATKLAEATRPADEAYHWALEQFDEHVSKLGSWFTELVTKYEKGLQEFQKSKMSDTPQLWKIFRYADGHTDVC